MPEFDDIDAATKESLGIPVAVPSARVRLTGEELGPRWLPFTMELVGCPFRFGFSGGGPFLTGPVSPRGWPPDAPTIEIFDTVYQVPTIELVQMVIRREDTSTWWEWRWIPGTTEERVTMHGEPETRRIGQEMRMGRRLFDEATLRGAGRPFGTDRFDYGFAAALGDAMDSFDRDGISLDPTADDVSSKLGYEHKSSFYDNLRRYRLNWPEVHRQWLQGHPNVKPRIKPPHS